MSEGTTRIKVAGAHQGFFADDATDVVHHGNAALETGSVGEGEVAADLTLVVIRNEGCRHHGQSRGRDDKAAQQIATQFDVRFVPFGNLYNTLCDVVVLAEPGLPMGSHKTEFNPSYLAARMTVCDVTEMPFDSALIKQARERGSKVVEPRAIDMDKIAAQVKSITGKDVAAESFEKFVNAALDE